MIKSSFIAVAAAGCIGILASSSAHADVNPRAAELKEQIRTIAIENMLKSDNLQDVRATLDPLVAELETIYGNVLPQDELPLLKGAWKQLWTDDVNPEPPGFKVDRDGTYQVVTDKGYFYNLGDEKGFINILGVLRGKYEVAGEFLNIEFTKVRIRPYPLQKQENLELLAEKIEAGKEFLIKIPSFGSKAKGPVGVKGNIRNLYLDDNFRVAYGSNLERGEYKIYVLDRVQTPVKYK